MKLYKSKLNVVKNKNEWAVWATVFYKGVLGKDFRGLPDDWFKRLSSVLNLTEIVV